MSEQETTNAIKEAKRAYYKQYRAKNRERIKQINDRYWAKKAAKARDEHEQTTESE